MLAIKIIVMLFAVLTGVFAILWVIETNKTTEEKTELLKRVEELEKNRLNNAKTDAKVFELDGEIFRKDQEIKALKEQLASAQELTKRYSKKACDAVEKQKSLIDENEYLQGLIMFDEKIEKKLREEIELLRNRLAEKETEALLKKRLADKYLAELRCVRKRYDKFKKVVEKEKK